MPPWTTLNARDAEVPEESPPVHVLGAFPPIPAPAPKFEDVQASIDAALQEWNGDIASKRVVAQYMEEHARDKGTAAWLRQEYGDDLPAFPVPSARTDLPWSKVQRHLAQLIKEDRFFTPEELDNFADIDTAAVREHLEQSGEQLSPFVERVMADVEQIAASQEAPAPEQAAPNPAIREIYSHYKPIVGSMIFADEAYRNACANSDKETALLEGHEAVKRAALTITASDFMRLYFDMPEFRDCLHREVLDATYPVLSQPEQSAPPDLSDQPITRDGDTITIGRGDAAHEVDITVSDREWQAIQKVIGATEQPTHDPLAPAAKNFRITDDHLGEGGPKTKFRRNMDAINTLQWHSVHPVRRRQQRRKPGREPYFPYHP